MFAAKDVQKFHWQKLPIAPTLLLIVLGGLLLFGAVPGYLQGGQWRWQSPPAVSQIKALRQIRAQGLDVPGWTTLNQGQVTVGGEKWSLQTLKPTGSTPKIPQDTQALLLLRPQMDDRGQPQVEWMDIRGLNSWTEDSERSAQLQTPNAAGQPATTQVRFLRGWSQGQKTYAVLQWYAWPYGGSPTPADWFWGDRRAQWHNQRLPWVAVTLMVPMEPLGDLEPTWPLMESLGQSVQTAINQIIKN